MRISKSAPIVLAALLSACTSTNEGQVRLGLTSKTVPDLPAMLPKGMDAVPTSAQLMVTVTQVDVRVAVAKDNDKARPVAKVMPTDNDRDPWTTVFQGQQRLNLFDAAATEAFLGTASVPAGRITGIRMILANDAVLVVNGTSLPLACPSCTETGIKVVMGDLDAVVTAGGHLHIALDFDLSLSLVMNDGALQLKPVIRIAEVDDHD
jgi:hypothetical protein